MARAKWVLVTKMNAKRRERHDFPFEMQKGAEEVVSQKTVVQRPIEEESSRLFVKRSLCNVWT
jgi:hypothetical protein